MKFQQLDRVRVNDQLSGHMMSVWSDRVGREGIVLKIESEEDYMPIGSWRPHRIAVLLDGDHASSPVWFLEEHLDLVARPIYEKLRESDVIEIEQKRKNT